MQPFLSSFCENTARKEISRNMRAQAKLSCATGAIPARAKKSRENSAGRVRAVCFFLALLLLFWGVAVGLPHDCAGEDCEVCALLADLQKRLTALLPLLVFALAALRLGASDNAVRRPRPLLSPVSRFDKMTD